MSTASAVPETFSLEGDDAKKTLRSVGRWRLIRDSFTRFRTADGFSHTRAAAHAAILTAFPMLITVIGVASVFQLESFRNVLEQTLLDLAPGPAGRLLSTAFREGSEQRGGAALLGGLIGALVSGTFAMAQVERGCNRIYGMVRDRKISLKLGWGLLLYVSAGVLLAIAFVLLAVGKGLENGLAKGGGWSDTSAAVFGVLRWPAGLVVTFLALTLIYKVSPNRRQPGATWLQTGTITATLLWTVLTAALALYYKASVVRTVRYLAWSLFSCGRTQQRSRYFSGWHSLLNSRPGEPESLDRVLSAATTRSYGVRMRPPIWMRSALAPKCRNHRQGLLLSGEIG